MKADAPVETVAEMQTVLPTYLTAYNEKRQHQGRGMNWLPLAIALRAEPVLVSHSYSRSSGLWRYQARYTHERACHSGRTRDVD